MKSHTIHVRLPGAQVEELRRAAAQQIGGDAESISIPATVRHLIDEFIKGAAKNREALHGQHSKE